MNVKPELICIDIGNSSIKSTYIFSEKIHELQVWESLEDCLFLMPDDVPIMISSVKKLKKTSLLNKKVTLLDSSLSLPIKICYENTGQLGADRIANAVGAKTIFPNKDVAIVDIGTCITMDLVDRQGVFQGGRISPGIRLRLKAMQTHTDLLIDVSKEWQEIEKKRLGKSTKECLAGGVFFGILDEIQGFIDNLQRKLNSVNIILCGRDSLFFESKLKGVIFADTKITHQGLYTIWKFQQENISA